MTDEQRAKQEKKELLKEGVKREHMKSQRLQKEVAKIRAWKEPKKFDNKKKLKRMRHKENQQAKRNLEKYKQQSNTGKPSGDHATSLNKKFERPQSEPKVVASNVVWVGGLERELKSGEVRKWFEEKCGAVKKVFVMRPDPQATTTYAFVHFEDDKSAQKALGLAGKHFSETHTTRLKIHLSTGKDSIKKAGASDGPEKPLKQAVLEAVPATGSSGNTEQEELEQELRDIKARKAAKKRKKGASEEGDPQTHPPAQLKTKAAKSKWPGHEEQSVDSKKYMANLEGGTFRMLNEMFCTSNSADAKKFFEVSPDMFETYHSGYRHQVEKWPVNPLDVIISDLKRWKKGYPAQEKGKEKHYADTTAADGDEETDGKGIPRYWQVCDLGCGEAKLALELSKNKVLSYDLVAVNDRVTVADIAHTPAESFSCEVAVMCLAMLGTNYLDYIREAHRILTHRGLLKVAELASRILSPELFVNLMKIMGFWCLRMERINDIFWLFDFQKRNDPVHEWKKRVERMNLAEILQPFKYKKR
uniref:Ribosomal RNA-processing protein 8 n=1 Tax=Eutreptiella gymnastica TaxID=73025 RepID=A0A7S1N7E0_9EUGL